MAFLDEKITDQRSEDDELQVSDRFRRQRYAELGWNYVLAECRLILFETETSQPPSEVHNGVLGGRLSWGAPIAWFIPTACARALTIEEWRARRYATSVVPGGNFAFGSNSTVRLHLWDGSLPLDSFRAVRMPATEAVGGH
jgi:hypothetical protein